MARKATILKQFIERVRAEVLVGASPWPDAGTFE